MKSFGVECDSCGTPINTEKPYVWGVVQLRQGTGNPPKELEIDACSPEHFNAAVTTAQTELDREAVSA